MKVAIVGSRTLVDCIDEIKKNLPANTSEIVSGGAVGVDKLAEKVAKQENLAVKIFLPEYDLFGKIAPIQRNRTIADYSDLVLAFWDGRSRGTKDIVEYCLSSGKPCKVIML